MRNVQAFSFIHPFLTFLLPFDGDANSSCSQSSCNREDYIRRRGESYNYIFAALTANVRYELSEFLRTPIGKENSDKRRIRNPLILLSRTIALLIAIVKYLL